MKNKLKKLEKLEHRILKVNYPTESQTRRLLRLENIKKSLLLNHYLNNKIIIL